MINIVLSFINHRIFMLTGMKNNTILVIGLGAFSTGIGFKCHYCRSTLKHNYKVVS